MTQFFPRAFFNICLTTLVIFSGCSSKPEIKKKYVIARVNSWEPLDLYGADKSLAAFLDDFFQQISHEEQASFQIVSGENQSPQHLLESNRYDGVLTAMSITPATRNKYDFSDPLFISGPVIVVSRFSKYKSVADLTNAEIGIDRNIFYSITESPNPDWILKPYDSVFPAIERVASNDLDGVVMNFILASRLSKGLYSGRIRLLLPPLVTYSVRLVVPKGENAGLLELVNSGLSKLKKSGLYDKILTYWGLDNALPQVSADAP